MRGSLTTMKLVGPSLSYMSNANQRSLPLEKWGYPQCKGRHIVLPIQLACGGQSAPWRLTRPNVRHT